MFVDTALRADAKRRVREIGSADIIVGIPTYKNAKTIGAVIEATAEGLARHFPDARSVIVVSDGLSTDDTVQVAQMTPVPEPVETVVTLYQGLSGKGSAIRAVFEIAQGLDPQALVLMDADLRSVTPAWVERLAGPIMSNDADFVTPYYSRHPNEAAINDLLAYPLTRALYGPDLRQPLGGEVALVGDLVDFLASKDVWETDVARFGTHIWMTTLAITRGWRLAQAGLSTKTHDYKDPAVGFEPKFLQVAGTMFRLMTIYRRAWPTSAAVRSVPVYGSTYLEEPEEIPPALDSIWGAFNKGLSQFWDLWPTVLTPENWDGVRQNLRQTGERSYQLEMPPALWARVAYDFAVVYNKGEGDPDKVVTALLPFYYARKADLIKQATQWDHGTYERHIRDQADLFVQLKPYLLERWESYIPWSQVEL
ncbi:MAG: Glucosylglycerate synthase [Anaerolineales bacterium]|nr:Glucosylglycerate synthase [Anaerolineales bacterium]